MINGNIKTLARDLIKKPFKSKILQNSIIFFREQVRGLLALLPNSFATLLFKSVLLAILSLLSPFRMAFCQDDSLKLNTFKPRVDFKAKFEPGGVLIGAGQVRTSNTFEFANAIGREPFMHMDYAGLKGFIKGNAHIDSLALRLKRFPWNCALQLGLSMTTDGKPDLHYEHKVAKGEYDDQIAYLIKFLSKLDRQVYLRVGYEFNGEWNGYKDSTFKEAYKRIADSFRKAQCDNVALIWCFSADGKNHDFMRYYPGDSYVDWWAIDLFGQNHFAHPATRAFVDSSLAHKRPLMIGESTARRTDLSKTENALKRWFVPSFNLIRNTPNLKAFCYINEDWTNTLWPQWGDARVHKYPDIQNWVRSEISHKHYISAKP